MGSFIWLFYYVAMHTLENVIILQKSTWTWYLLADVLEDQVGNELNNEFWLIVMQEAE